MTNTNIAVAVEEYFTIFYAYSRFKRATGPRGYCPTQDREYAIQVLREAGWAEPELTADLIRWPGEFGWELYHHDLTAINKRLAAFKAAE